jgi:hypothetical protein
VVSLCLRSRCLSAREGEITQSSAMMMRTLVVNYRCEHDQVKWMASFHYSPCIGRESLCPPCHGLRVLQWRGQQDVYCNHFSTVRSFHSLTLLLSLAAPGTRPLCPWRMGALAIRGGRSTLHHKSEPWSSTRRRSNSSSTRCRAPSAPISFRAR